MLDIERLSHNTIPLRGCPVPAFAHTGPRANGLTIRAIREGRFRGVTSQPDVPAFNKTLTSGPGLN
jgi:hypothetical protein